ncbi:MAG: hypothetical protein DMD36_02950 [Gemmatimonadetes bacterium]|nr:MAG: hypothetical protein DMD36_02950 [Gemmatimonadota bacterium]
MTPLVLPRRQLVSHRHAAALVCAIALSGATWALAQAAQGGGGEPLRKSDVIRLLSNPLIGAGEVAALIRRNCLAFRPTERDWADLRAMGANADVLGSVGGCAARAPRQAKLTAPAAAAASHAPLSPHQPPQPPQPLPTAPLPPTAVVASLLTPRVVVGPGADALVLVQAKKSDGAVAGGFKLMLRGSAGIPGGAASDVEAVTDDSGFAAFHLPAGRHAARYRVEVVGAARGALPGRPQVELVVRPGAPARVEVPQQLDLGLPGDGTLALPVAVRDSFGNPVPGEVIELRPAQGAMGVVADTRTTDSLGRALFVIPRAGIREPGRLEVFARGARLASVDATVPNILSSITTGFVAGDGQRGVVRSRLTEPMVFQARGIAGNPLPNKRVSFRAVNAEIAPDSAVTDSAGQVRLDVTLGSKAGTAVVTAMLDSVQKQATLYVDAGIPVELMLEREGIRVDGGHIVVELGAPFTLTLRARDGYGNPGAMAGLLGPLREMATQFNARSRLVKLVSVQPDSSAAILKFKATDLGSTEVTLFAGLRTSVTVEVVQARR